MKLTTHEIECRVAGFFNYRQNIVVPNISWGMGIHECDLLIVRNSGYGIEVEIKISKSDLKKDREKQHQHISNKIKELWFAIPDYLKDCTEFIPERAGILVLDRDVYYGRVYINLRILRKAKVNKSAVRFTDQERMKIAHLGTMRIWNLKQNIIDIKRKIQGVEQRLF